MRLVDRDLKKTLFISKSDDSRYITMGEGNVVLYAEKTLSSNSAAPYIASFTALRSFLRNNDYTDSVITVGLPVNSISALQSILNTSDNVRLLSYTVKTQSCNIGFFGGKYRALISFDAYIGLLIDRLPKSYKVYTYTKDTTGYVIIEKN